MDANAEAVQRKRRMTDWICKEVHTDNGGYFEPVEELIRCKDCKHMHEDGAESYCDDSGRYIDGTGFCKWAERIEE